MLMDYHIGRLVLGSLCVGAFVAAGIWWCSFCRLQPAKVLMNYHIGRLALSSLCVGAFVAAGIWWCSFCRLQPAKRTENKTTDVVIHQHSRKLLKMDILTSKTC